MRFFDTRRIEVLLVGGGTPYKKSLFCDKRPMRASISGKWGLAIARAKRTGTFPTIWHTLAPFAAEMCKNDFSRDDRHDLSKIGKNAPPSREKSKTTLSRSASASGRPDWVGQTWSRAHFVKAVYRQHCARRAQECVFCAQEPTPDFSPKMEEIPQAQQ
jgi:hypothetical protein